MRVSEDFFPGMSKQAAAILFCLIMTQDDSLTDRDREDLISLWNRDNGGKMRRGRYNAVRNN